MGWEQRTVRLSPRPRGCHLITQEVLEAIPEVRDLKLGLLHIFIQHTSASLTINENAEREVRTDLAASLDALAPESFPYTHTAEGPDDMPAHVKASLMGSSVSLPVSGGRLALGTWQGIYLCEHRNHGGSRQLVLTLHGE
jgi:secondary thiamine-phosphate synthase enzyme